MSIASNILIATTAATLGGVTLDHAEIRADLSSAITVTESSATTSAALAEIVEKLKGDWSFLRAFYNDREGVLSTYPGLTTQELNALRTHNPSDYIRLGIDKDEAIIIASGTHRGTYPRPT